MPVRLPPASLISIALACALTIGAAGPARADDGGQMLELPAFTGVEADGNFTLDIVTRVPQTVRLSGDRAVVSRVRATVRDGTLDLKLLPDPHPRLFGSPSPPRVTIAMAHLDRVALDGACQLSARRLAESRVQLALGGASRAEIDGSVGKLTADLDGASHLSAERLTVQTATLAMSGVSQASVHAVGGLTIAASGAARVVYSGHPSVSEALSGVASVHHR